MKKNYWLIIALIEVILLSRSASAYIDPGTGAIIIGGIWQLIVALLAALGALLVKMFWKIVKRARQIGKKPVQEKDKEKESPVTKD